MFRQAVESFLKQASLKGVRAEQTEQLRSAYEVVGWSGFIRKQLEELQRLAAKQDVPAVLFVKLYLSLGQKDEALGGWKKVSILTICGHYNSK